MAKKKTQKEGGVEEVVDYECMTPGCRTRV